MSEERRSRQTAPSRISIERFRDAFEATRTKAERPEIAQWLSSTSEVERSLILWELLCIELWW